MLRTLMGCVLALLLTACGAHKPLKPDVASRVKQGKMAVLFYDDVGEIKYTEDKYLVLAVAQVASNSTYAGFWSPNPELSEAHAAGLNSLGLNAQSAYTLLPAAFIEENTAAERELYTLKRRDKSKPEPKPPAAGTPALTPKLREALLEKGQDTLVWVTWSGFNLHLLTLGLAPREEYATGFWMFDLKSNQLLWNGLVSTFDSTTIPDGQTGKEFLESNGLAGLKAESAARIKDYYRPGQTNFKSFAVQSGLPGGVP
jgi:hypothetical protein